MSFCPSGWDIAHWAWNTDVVCTPCVHRLVAVMVTENRVLPESDTEALVAQFATICGYDPNDTNQCPVPVFASDAQREHCGQCGEEC